MPNPSCACMTGPLAFYPRSHIGTVTHRALGRETVRDRRRGPNRGWQASIWGPFGLHCRPKLTANSLVCMLHMGNLNVLIYTRAASRCKLGACNGDSLGHISNYTEKHVYNCTYVPISNMYVYLIQNHLTKLYLMCHHES